MTDESLRNSAGRVKSFSAWTLLWIAVILSGTFYFRQLLNLVRELVGRESVALLIWAIFGVFLLLLIRKVSKEGAELLPLLALFAIGIAYAYTFEIQEERMHIAKYGVLGLLLARDMRRMRQGSVMGGAIAIGFAATSFDELVQSLLPYRVGDLRDVWFGVVGSAWGAAMFLCISRQRDSEIERSL